MDLGVEVICASSGPEALDLMLDHSFAVAILDVQMPEMNGFELAQLMRGAERTKNVPIIFVTAGVSTSISEFKGYESGAVDFLPKPFNPEILRAKVRIFLQLAEQREKLNQKVLELEEVSRLAAAAQVAAEQANQLKSSFLANMSHEIRTPLGALMGFAELLKGDLPEEQKARYLDVILRNGKSLVQLIDEILDLSKIEAGHIEIETQRVEPQSLMEEIRILLTPLVESKNINLNLTLSENLPQWVGTDPLRLRQILTNLLGNAIKFTEQGSVSLEIDYQLTDTGGKIVCLVKDTGIGIHPEFAARLFQPFSQGDVSITRSFGGTGLGLSLSRKLANLLGGNVRLHSSEPQVGSAFEVTVSDRLNEISHQAMDHHSFNDHESELIRSPEHLKNIKVLVVDDSPDNQLFVRMLLSQQGAKVEVANNGKEGIVMAQKGQYDVVLMDLQMPVCDGLQATRVLRSEGFIKPILALTANAMKEERDRCLTLGFNDYVSKPVDKLVLFSAIHKQVRAHSTGPHSEMIN